MAEAQGKGGGGEVIAVDFRTRKVISRTKSEPSPYEGHLGFFTKMATALEIVSVSFDPRAVGVKVHEVVKNSLPATLNFSHLFGRTDFKYDLTGIGSTLMVGGKDEFVFVPWEAVLSIFDPKDTENKKEFGQIVLVIKVPIEAAQVVDSDPPA